MSVKKPKQLPDSEIKALIDLIANEDNSNAEKLTARLAEIIRCDPERVDTIIGREFHDTPDCVGRLLMAVRAEMILQMFRNIFTRAGEPDLEEGLFLLSKFFEPRLSLAEFTGKIDSLAEFTAGYAKPATDLASFLALFNKALFEEKGFTVAPEGRALPQAMYLSSVLESKQGTSLALSSQFILVAEKMGIPSYGTHLPGMVIVQLHTPGNRIFIAPSLKGKIISRHDCLRYVRSRMMAWEDYFLDPADSAYMLSLTIGNLIFQHNRLGNEDTVEHLKRFLGVIQTRAERTVS
ncbi:MAG: transglutaminase family protein [Elusimicrobiaceae bacterium]|nr:transglutaminase family protein [Elusimicrobiaceae bacterium]